MRVLFIQQDHMSPTGPVGEAFADHGFDVREFTVVLEEHFGTPSVATAGGSVRRPRRNHMITSARIGSTHEQGQSAAGADRRPRRRS
jgi:hypothetical protein